MNIAGTPVSSDKTEMFYPHIGMINGETGRFIDVPALKVLQASDCDPTFCTTFSYSSAYSPGMVATLTFETLGGIIPMKGQMVILYSVDSAGAFSIESAFPVDTNLPSARNI